MPMHSLSERRLAKAELPSPPHSTSVAPHGLCTAQQVQVGSGADLSVSLLKFSAWTVREEFSLGGRLDASLRHAQAASSSLASVARARFRKLCGCKPLFHCVCMGFSWRGGDVGGLSRLGSGLEPGELRSAAARAVTASFAELDRLEVGASYRSVIHADAIAEKTAPFSSE